MLIYSVIGKRKRAPLSAVPVLRKQKSREPTKKTETSDAASGAGVLLDTEEAPTSATTRVLYEGGTCNECEWTHLEWSGGGLVVAGERI